MEKGSVCGRVVDLKEDAYCVWLWIRIRLNAGQLGLDVNHGLRCTSVVEQIQLSMLLHSEEPRVVVTADVTLSYLYFNACRVHETGWSVLVPS